MISYYDALASESPEWSGLFHDMIFANNEFNFKGLLHNTLNFYLRSPIRDFTLSDKAAEFGKILLETRKSLVFMISITGGIGTGKTTYINKLRDEAAYKAIYIEEPHNEWCIPCHLMPPDCDKYSEFSRPAVMGGRKIDLLRAQLSGATCDDPLLYVLFQISTITSRMRHVILLQLLSILDLTHVYRKDLKLYGYDQDSWNPFIAASLIANELEDANRIQDLIRQSSYTEVISERNIYVDTLVFAHSAALNNMCDYGVYTALLSMTIGFMGKFHSKGFRIDFIGLTNVPFNVQLYRIAKRNRPGEIELYFGVFAEEVREFDMETVSPEDFSRFTDHLRKCPIGKLRSREHRLPIILEDLGILTTE